MQTSCPSCGADIFPGARFCRRCGAPLHAQGGETGDVSPNAATVPLVPDETRPTGGLAPGEEQHVAQQTSRVSLAEMERLLRTQDDGGQQHSHPTGSEATHGPAVTRPNLPGYEDEELTITVPRSAETHEPGDFEATIDFDATRPVDPEATIPAGVGSWPYVPTTNAETHEPPTADRANADASGDGTTPPSATSTNSPVDVSAVPKSLPPRPGASPARRAWPLVVAVCVVAAVFVSGGAWLVYRLLHRPALTDLPTQGPTPPPVAEANAQFEQKLADAEALLASGDMQGALARLREANGLDPSNTRAHRRLGELLLSNGARREAIEELRALTRNAPDDSGAWRQLALAQVDEGLDRDAVESFRRFVALVGGESSVEPHDLLVYAGALLKSGRADEARSLFQHLASSPDATVSGLAQSQLDTLARAQSTPTPAPRTGEPTPAPRSEEIVSVSATPTPQPAPVQPTPQPTPTPAPQAPASPADRYGHGVQLWSSNRGAALEEFRAAAAGGNIDAHYYLGLAYVEGRKLSSLQRAEVVAALQHFQLAQRGQHASQARGYAQQLEKEFDRLRRQ